MRGIQPRLSIKIASVALATGMAIASSAAWADSDDRLRLEARLSDDNTLASAHGKWEVRRNRLKASVEGEDMAVVLGDDGLNTVTATVMLNCPGGEEQDFMVAGIGIDNLGFFDFNVDLPSLEGVPDCTDGILTVMTTGGDMLSGMLAEK